MENLVVFELEIWHEQGPKNLMFVRGWAEICDRYFDLMREANGLTD